jgi:hypothetical protein
MPTRTVYCAQGFWRRDGSLLPGYLYRSCREDRARARGQTFARYADGAVVYQVEVEPETDLPGDVVILERHGCAPSAGL